MNIIFKIIFSNLNFPMIKYTKNISEPWFSLIKLGIKKCEGRLKKGDFDEMKKDGIEKDVKFHNDNVKFL